MTCLKPLLANMPNHAPRYVEMISSLALVLGSQFQRISAGMLHSAACRYMFRGSADLGDIRGNSFHSVPSRSLPPDFGRRPPHCLKKKGTSWRTHWSRTDLTQSSFIGRALGPLSPPTMTQLMPARFNSPGSPSKGSIDRNRVATAAC